MTSQTNSVTDRSSATMASPPGEKPQDPGAFKPAIDLEALHRQEERENANRIARERAEISRRQRAEELEARVGQALIPRRYREYRFDTFPVERITDPVARERAVHARNVCERYAERWEQVATYGRNLLLVGRNGTGKTGLACAIANHVIREHFGTAYFTSAYGAIRYLRDAWKRRDKTESQSLRDLVDVDLLVLDEMGVQMGSDNETLLMTEIINCRYADGRPTLVISNLPVDDEPSVPMTGLRTWFGPRLWERLTDNQSPIVACDWDSLRGGPSA